MSSNSPQTNIDHIHRLRGALESCSKSIEAGGLSQSEQSLSELVDFLNSLAELAVENEAAETTAFEIVSEVQRFVSSSSLDQAVIDALSFELPKAVARFACASKRCSDVAGLVIDRFIEMCSPRDMLSVFCEALGCPSETFRVPRYFSCLLTGIGKVLVSIRRRHFEQVKAAVPVILNVVKAMALESDDEDTDCEDLLLRTTGIANSIQEICVKLEGEDSKRTRALFALFILQTMTLVTIAMRNKVSSCLPLVLQLTRFLRHCDLSYIGLLTGHDVEMISDIVLKDDGDDHTSWVSYVKHGSSLSAIWAYMSNEVAAAAEVDFVTVKNELQRDQTIRWQAIGMLKHIFSSVHIPWELKKHAISFLLTVMDAKSSLKSQDELHDYSMYIPSLYASLQAIQSVIIYAPDAETRKNAFELFKRVLADISPSLRFDILCSLVKNSDSSSMIAILLHSVKEEMLAENSKRISGQVLQEENEATPCTTFWNTDALEFVELVLRPAKGGPPDLPEYSDAVLSALNLYRFILITETTGRTNRTGVLSKDNLQKAYNEWLLPLRTLVTGIVAESQKDYDQLASDISCAFNPLELVLYRCIELVEENLKRI